MPPFNTDRLHVRRSRRTDTARSRAAHGDGAAPRPQVPATIWVPPPAAVGDRWRTWLLAAVDRAFLPARGRRVDLSGQLATELHDRRPHHCQGGSAAGARSTPATPYWAALIRDQSAPSALATAGTTSPGDRNPLTEPPPNSPAPTSPAPTSPALTGLPAAVRADELADLVFVDLAGAVADDRLGILAARALRGGGILAVLTHCHHTSGNDAPIRHGYNRRSGDAASDDNGDCSSQADSGDDDGGECDGERGAGNDPTGLVDPTGSVVASAQNADLLYLQHIVIPRSPLTHPAAIDSAANESGATDRAGASIEPVPHVMHRHQPTSRARHQIAHADLLVFARAHGLPAVTRPAPASLPPRAAAGAPVEELLIVTCGSQSAEGVRP